MISNSFFRLVFFVFTSYTVSCDVVRVACHKLPEDPPPESLEDANLYCETVLKRFLNHPVSVRSPYVIKPECSRIEPPPAKGRLFRCTVRSLQLRWGVPFGRVDMSDIVTDSSFWSIRPWEIHSDAYEKFMKGSKRGAFLLVERKKFEKRWNNIEVYAAIGVRRSMEDTFIAYENARGTGASFFGVFDGHVGDYAAIYARDRLMKRIINKIAAVKQLIRKTNSNQSGTPTTPEKLPPERELLHIGGINYCMTPEPRRWRKEKSEREKMSNSIDNPDLKNYIEAEGLIDYEKLLTDVFISTDLKLCVSARRRESEAGTTALVAIIEGSQLIVANVGDSRGVMCDSEGNPVPLSSDHKPDREDEWKRLERAGGKVGYNRGGCARLDAYIAISRSLGDQKTKLDHRLIPTPEVYIFDLADHRPEFIVLATDGLYDELSSEEVVSFIRARLDEPDFGAKSLVRYAFLAQAKDNITVMVINLKGYDWPRNPRTALKNKSWRSRRLALKRPLGGNV